MTLLPKKNPILLRSQTYLLVVVSMIVALVRQGGASEPYPLKHVVSSYGGDYLFVMGDPKEDGSGSGTCYEIINSQLKMLWEVDGFYALPYELQLSDDGAILVRQCRLKFSPDLDLSSSIIEVYRNGNLLTRFPLRLFSEDIHSMRSAFAIMHVLPFENGSVTLIERDDAIDLLTEWELLEDNLVDKKYYITVTDLSEKTLLLDLESGAMVASEPREEPTPVIGDPFLIKDGE